MVGVYVRVSTLQQKDNYSTDVQRQYGIRFAESIGEMHELYDEAKSGKDLERPEFIRLLRDIESGRVNKVWVIEFSRLARDTEDALGIRKIFIQNNAQIFVNDVLMDLSTPEAVLMYNIKSSIAEYERTNTIARVVRARKQQIDKGYQAFSSIFGYAYRYSPEGKKVWYIVEREAELVRKIFTLYGMGHSYQLITSALNDSGYRTKRGKKFAITTIAKLLAHPEYFGKTRNTKGEFIESKIYPPILSGEHFEALQKQHINRSVRAIQFRQAKTELAGVLRCEKCGAPYYTHRVKQYKNRKHTGVVLERYSHLRDTKEQISCDNKPVYVRRDLVDNFVSFCYQAHIRTRYLVKSLMEKRKDEALFEEKEMDKQVLELKKKIDDVEKKRQRLISGIAAGLYSVEDIRDQITKLNKDKDEFQASLDTVQMNLRVALEEFDKIVEAFSDRSIEEYETASPEKKRQIYLNVIQSLTIKDGWISLVFITGRKYDCPMNRIPIYLKVVREVGKESPFSKTKSRHRWDELFLEDKKTE